ncbi:MAG TPA: adenylate/guanylate cyclase domain-containing protein, partial [Solirubrobacteraceae bacterium]|nr:adenylate/guanylate cyclase domain-containing protein [Solirubrobacteraceae bacterium]
ARYAWHEAYDDLKLADADGLLTADDHVLLADAAWWLGHLDESIAARERAFAAYRADGQPRRAALVALQLAHDHGAKLSHSLASGWFQRAERLLAQEEECVEQGFLAWYQSMFAMFMPDLDLAYQLATRALDIGTRFGNADLQAYGLIIQGRALVGKGEVESGLAHVDEATIAAVSGELGPMASGLIYCIAISTSAQLGDYGRAGEWSEAARRWCERQSINGFPGICRVHRAEVMRLRGSWAEAEQEVRRAVNELREFNLEFVAEGLYELGEIRLRIGDLAGAEEAYRSAHELGRDPQPGLALVRLAEGEVQAAATALAQVLRTPTVEPLRRARLLPAQVEVAVAAGDLDTARAAADELESLAQTFAVAAVSAAARWARGNVQLAEGDVQGAVAALRDSWRLWKDIDLPYEAARSRMMLGVALRRCGDEDGARLELRAARASFESLGAALDLPRVNELLGEDVAQESAGAAASAQVRRTFAFTDIVASTSLVEAMGDAAWGNLLEWHDQTLRRLFGEHCGEVVKQVGDGFFVAFTNPNEAVECAAAIQRKLAQHRRDHGFAPQVRIGLHTADAIRKGGDYSGMGVHAAARVGALAGAGEIVATTEVVAGARIRFPVSPARSVTLKGIAEPVSVVAIDAS